MNTYTYEDAQMALAWRNGYEASLGGFHEALVTAFGRADSGNFARLSAAFPGLGAAFRASAEDLADFVTSDKRYMGD